MIPPAPAPPLEIQPEAGTRLAVLHAAYFDAKAKADSATKALKAVTDGLKLELTQAAPEGEAKIRLGGNAGPPLALTWVVSKRLDTKRIQAELPAVAEQYVTVSGSWQLREAKGGGE